MVWKSYVIEFMAFYVTLHGKLYAKSRVTKVGGKGILKWRGLIILSTSLS